MVKDLYERDFKIIIPSTNSRNIIFVARNMSKQFGGVTLYPQISGLWIDATGKIVHDDNLMFFSSRDFEGRKDREKILDADRKFMKKLALNIGKKTMQDAIWVEEDIVDDVTFINIPKNNKRIKEVF